MPQPHRTFYSNKLLGNLPLVIGKTISQALIVEHENLHRIQFYLLFTDGTAYEFYTDVWLRGANSLDHADLDTLLGFARGARVEQRVVPDRRRVPRGEGSLWGDSTPGQHEEPPGRPADDGDGDGE